jgi:hypothetical protein
MNRINLCAGRANIYRSGQLVGTEAERESEMERFVRDVREIK